MITRLLYLFLGSVFAVSSYGQGFQWWNDLHNWNGVTPWRNYLQMSSSGLGPNALPVPTFKSLGVGEGIKVESQLRYHHFAEDPTYDYQLRVEYGFNDRIAVAAWMVVVEHFNTSIALRNERRLRLIEPRGFTSGDVYFGTFIKAVEENERRPYVLFSANIKTASGNNFGGGRHTDTPGYYFDVLAAKTYGRLRPYVATGLYVYQTWSTRNFQNDAWMYALGFHILGERHNHQVEWAGYNGYFDNGDKPSVLRLSTHYDFLPENRLSLRLQFALNDLDYHTISLGYTYIY